MSSFGGGGSNGYPDLSNLRGSLGGSGGSGGGMSGSLSLSGGSAYSGLSGMSSFMEGASSGGKNNNNSGSGSLGGGGLGGGSSMSAAAGAGLSANAPPLTSNDTMAGSSTSTELSRKVTPDDRNRETLGHPLASFKAAAQDAVAHHERLRSSTSSSSSPVETTTPPLPPAGGLGGASGVPSSTYLCPGTTSGGMSAISALTAAPSGGLGLGGTSTSAYPNLGGGGGASGSASLTGLGASDSFAGEMPFLTNTSGGSAGGASASASQLYPGVGSLGTFSAASCGGGANSGIGSHNKNNIGSGGMASSPSLHAQGTLGTLGSLPSFARQTTTAGTGVGTIDSGLFSIDEKMTSRAYPDFSSSNRQRQSTNLHRAASSTSGGIRTPSPFAGSTPSVSAAASASAASSAFHGTLCADDDLVNDASGPDEVLHAGFSDQMEAARCHLPVAALAEHHATMAASIRHSQSLGAAGVTMQEARAQATLLAECTSYGRVETSADLEARQIAAAMAMSLKESNDADARGVTSGTDVTATAATTAPSLRKQQSSTASAINDALAAYSRASSAGSVTSAAGRMGSLGMTDPLDAVHENGSSDARKVSACSLASNTAFASAHAPLPVRASSSSGFACDGDMLAAAALSEYRRKESESSVVSAPALTSSTSMSISKGAPAATLPAAVVSCRRFDSEGSAIAQAAAAAGLKSPPVASDGLKSPPVVSDGLKSPPPIDRADAVVADPTPPPLKPSQQSGPIKKRLKMGGLSSFDDGAADSSSGGNSNSDSGGIVDRVPALPKFDRGVSENINKMMAMADDSSISTAGSLARHASGGNANGNNPESEFVLKCEPVLLASPEDRQWLSDLLCFLRSQIEVFVATPEDVAARSRRGGIKEPIAVGRVGIRCRHCVHVPQDKRSKGAVSYPNSIRIVHQAVRNWQRYHFKSCPHISDQLREDFKAFKSTRCHSGNSSLRYWIESCEKLGMVDTPGSGIRLKRSAVAIAEQQQNVVSAVPSSSGGDPNVGQWKQQDPETASVATYATSIADEEMSHVSQHPDLPVRPLPPNLVEPSDVALVTPFLSLLLQQQQPTLYQDIDRLGKRRSRPLNFPGVECRHCSSRVASSGRYFPLTSTTLGNNNNPYNCVHSHLLKCRRCPRAVKDELNRLAESHVCDGGKLPGGWKKRFFDRVWGRIHGEAEKEENSLPSSSVAPNVAASSAGPRGARDEDVGAAAAALSALSGLSGMKRGHSQC